MVIKRPVPRLGQCPREGNCVCELGNLYASGQTQTQFVRYKKCPKSRGETGGSLGCREPKGPCEIKRLTRGRYWAEPLFTTGCPDGGENASQRVSPVSRG
jgi:hypothetical protein